MRTPGRMGRRTARRDWEARQQPGDWAEVNGFTVTRVRDHRGWRYWGSDHHEALRAFGLVA